MWREDDWENRSNGSANNKMENLGKVLNFSDFYKTWGLKLIGIDVLSGSRKSIDL